MSILRRIRWYLFLGVALATVAWLGIDPSHDRNWKLEHARLPRATFQGDSVLVENVRDFRTGSDDSVSRSYDDRTYDLNQLSAVWLCVAVFDEENRRGPAHSLLSFEFETGECVAISVEARKEVGESYSIYRGAFKRYELIYVVGDERDLILTRAAFRPDDVYLYPIVAPRDRVRALFVEMLEAANALHEKPRFYNTLTANCTTILRDHVNAIAPNRIPPSWKILLPGYVDELLQGLSLIDSDAPMEQARRKYWINDAAVSHAADPNFSRQIRNAVTAP